MSERPTSKKRGRPKKESTKDRVAAVRISDELKKRLGDFAAQRKMSMSEVHERALRTYLAMEESVEDEWY